MMATLVCVSFKLCLTLWAVSTPPLLCTCRPNLFPRPLRLPAPETPLVRQLLATLPGRVPAVVLSVSAFACSDTSSVGSHRIFFLCPPCLTQRNIFRVHPCRNVLESPSFFFKKKLNELYYMLVLLPSFLFIYFFLFRATPAAHGGSQARGPIGVVADGLWHGHSCADLCRACDLHPSSRQCRVLNPWSKARDRTCNVMVPSRIRFRGATTGTPLPSFLKVNSVPLCARAPLCMSSRPSVDLGLFPPLGCG